jgi:hypothetical protein
MEILQQEAPRLLGRAILPVAKIGHTGGTVFLFNYLVEQGRAGHGDKVATFLVTTRGVASGPAATLGLARHMISPQGHASDELAFPQWSDQWLRPADNQIDLALLPFAHLKDHARRKGWTWDTQQVTDGMLPKPGEQLSLLVDEIAVYGYEPQPARGLADWKPVLRPVSLQHMPDGAVGVSSAQTVLPGAPVVALAPRPSGYRFVVAGITGSPTASGDGTTQPFIPGAEIRAAAQEIFEHG